MGFNGDFPECCKRGENIKENSEDLGHNILETKSNIRIYLSKDKVLETWPYLELKRII